MAMAATGGEVGRKTTCRTSERVARAEALARREKYYDYSDWRQGVKIDSTLTATIVYLCVILIVNITWTNYTAHIAILEAKSGLSTEKILSLGQIITVINCALLFVFLFVLFALR